MSEQPPQAPRGLSYNQSFTSSYQAKAKEYAARLGRLLAIEYQSHIEDITSKIAKVIDEAEDHIHLIIDEEDQKKSLKLFRIQLAKLNRRANTSSRRRVYAARRLPQQ